jgi:hypothetical protein
MIDPKAATQPHRPVPRPSETICLKKEAGELRNHGAMFIGLSFRFSIFQSKGSGGIHIIQTLSLPRLHMLINLQFFPVSASSIFTYSSIVDVFTHSSTPLVPKHPSRRLENH